MNTKNLKLLGVLCCCLLLVGCSLINVTTTSEVSVFTDSLIHLESAAQVSDSTLSKPEESSENSTSKQNSSKAQKKAGTSSTASKTQSALKTKTYKPKAVAEKLLLCGRAQLVKSNVQLDWDCAAVHFRAFCSGSLSVVLSAEGSGIAYLRAFVDGKEISNGRIAVTAENKQSVTLAENLSQEVHEVCLLRISGSEPPYINLESITLTGSFETPPTLPNDRIIFIGGTAFTGEAALLSNDDFAAAGEDETPLRSVENRDSSKAFAYLTAKKLGLSYEIVARANTGFGISDFHNDPVNLTNLFNASSRRDGAADYSIPGRVKYVVISGVNSDFNYYLHQAEGKSAAESWQKQLDYISFMQRQYPGCKIIWCYGQIPISNYNLKNIQQSIQFCGGEAYGIYLFKFSQNVRGERPEPAVHAALAEELYSFICSLQ